MPITRLLKQRQLNVQQQNALAEHRLLAVARYWDQHPLPVALVAYGECRGIDFATSIILELGIDHPGMASLFGRLLDKSGRVIEFELATDDRHQTVLSVEQWQDITEQLNFSEHNKGRGKGEGAIALHVYQQVRTENCD